MSSELTYCELLRKRNGRSVSYEGENGSEELLNDCLAYVEWAAENPIETVKVVQTKDGPVDHKVLRVRLLSLESLSVFLGVTSKTWRLWRKTRPDLKDVIKSIDELIFATQIEQGAADTVNAMIVARVAGLKEHYNAELTGKDGKPMSMITSKMSPKEAAALYEQTLLED
jgi:hypothetical protein